MAKEDTDREDDQAVVRSEDEEQHAETSGEEGPVEAEINEESESESDVSLDEEDEELVGRVFYGSQIPDVSGPLIISDDEEPLSDVSESDLDGISAIDADLVKRYRQLKRKQVDEDLNEEDKKRLMMQSFNSDQMDRFEAYRRTTINKPAVKKVCNGVLGHSIPQNIAIVLAGLSKSYVSEIITKAFEVQEREYKADLIRQIENKKQAKKGVIKNLGNDKHVEVQNIKLDYGGDQLSPLKPEHIREAVRLYKEESSGSFSGEWRRQGEASGTMFR